MTAARTRAYRARIMADPAEIERRKREYLDRQRGGWERCDSGQHYKISVPVVRVLTDWHTDEHGCRARTVGNAG